MDTTGTTNNPPTPSREFRSNVEIMRLQSEVARLERESSSQTYRGNSVEHWYTKAKCYGDMVHGCSPALEAAGFPVDRFCDDGAVGGIARAVEAMQARVAELKGERDEAREAAKTFWLDLSYMDTNHWYQKCPWLEDE